MSTMATALAASRRSRSVAWGHYSKVGAATIATATLANSLVYFAGDALIGYDPDFVVLSSVAGIALFTFVPAVVATLLYAALLRFTSRPVGIFNVVSAIVFVVTTVPDFTYIPTVEGASNAQTAVLVLTHVVAAAIIVGMLTKLTAATER